MDYAKSTQEEIRSVGRLYEFYSTFRRYIAGGKLNKLSQCGIFYNKNQL
jgi:hypothetical protein